MDEWIDPAAIQKWWSTPSQSSIKRSYTAETVSSHRDVFPEAHHSNRMAMKLRAMLDKHQREKTVHLTSSVHEPVSQLVMAELGIESVYVTGEDSSTNDGLNIDSSTHLAGCTYETVPRKVESLYRSQLSHARAAKLRANSKPDDLMMPIIADGDSGHGPHSATMKMIELSVHAGVSGIHINDLSGTVKLNEKGDGTVLVPMTEHIRRLIAAKLQLDIMGSEVVLIHQTNAESATHITSTIDYRDRPFILGSTKLQVHDYISAKGPSSRSEWIRKAQLSTIDQAFRSISPNDVYEIYIKRTAGFNTSEAYRVATELIPSFYWSEDSARTDQGWYQFQGGVEAATSRAIYCAPYVDICWARTTTCNLANADILATKVLESHPSKWLAYNINDNFGDISDETLAKIPQQLASMGYNLQFLQLAGTALIGHGSRKAVEAIKEKGLFGYVHQVSRPAARHDGTTAEWWYKIIGRLIDSATSTVGYEQ